MLNIHEIIWAAGFFDGEGHVRFNRGNRHSDPQRRTYRNFQVEVPQKTTPLLERFKEAMGVGKVYGPYRNNKKGKFFSYRFLVSKHEDIEFVGELLFPWLGEAKREQFRKAIAGFRAPRLKPGPIENRNLTRNSSGRFQRVV